MKNKKNIAVEPFGLVQASGLTTQAVLETLEIADMWNCHIPSLLATPTGEERGYIGLAEVISSVAIVSLEQELQERGWEFASPSLFLCGKDEAGKWILPQLGDTFTVLNAPKHFPGRPDFYPWMHTAQGVRAFGLTPLSDIFTDDGDVRQGVRFPVVKTGK
ncbi:MAG: hypothetical protein ABI430_03010 [Candidatus Taylorbacteria bacterium]